MRIRIGHSPDPDDAFLFYAMTQGKISLPGWSVEHCLEGIEELNQRAMRAELEMTAISLHAYPYCADRYLPLTSGASVGELCGPVLVARRPMDVRDLRGAQVAIPGRLTTAALLLELAAGKVPTRILPFDRILDAVADGEVDAGLLIHEGQITYADRGLHKVVDLGEWWRSETGLPVPLGVNVVRRDMGGERLKELAGAFQRSLEYAMAHRPEALAYAARYARGLDARRTDRFVGMYVNRWSVDCRPDGARAMQELLDRAAGARITPRRVRLEFVEA